MNDPAQTIELTVIGMTCGHCRAAVESALRDVSGVTAVSVDLEHGRAEVKGEADLSSLVRAVEEAGYDASPAESR